MISAQVSLSIDRKNLTAMIGAKGMFLLAGYEGKGDGERMYHYHLITWGTYGYDASEYVVQIYLMHALIELLMIAKKS
jgi:hypothetical protein